MKRPKFEAIVAGGWFVGACLMLYGANHQAYFIDAAHTPKGFTPAQYYDGASGFIWMAAMWIALGFAYTVHQIKKLHQKVNTYVEALASDADTARLDFLDRYFSPKGIPDWKLNGQMVKVEPGERAFRRGLDAHMTLRNTYDLPQGTSVVVPTYPVIVENLKAHADRAAFQDNKYQG